MLSFAVELTHPSRGTSPVHSTGFGEQARSSMVRTSLFSSKGRHFAPGNPVNGTQSAGADPRVALLLPSVLLSNRNPGNFRAFR